MVPSPVNQTREGAMFERFTERARQVVILAQEEARGLEHGYIGTEHVLLGLLREHGGIGAQVLHAYDVYVPAVTEHIKARSHVPIEMPEHLKGTSQIPFTPRCKKLMEIALREALSLGHNYIGTEHLLLALIRDHEGMGMKILEEEYGLTWDQIKNKVVRALVGPSSQRQEVVALQADTINPLVDPGDRLKAALMCLIEYNRAFEMPYEIAMAINLGEKAINDWERVRVKMR